MSKELKKIQFGKKDFYIVDEFMHKGVEYWYIYEDIYQDGMDIENVSGDMEVNFIYKVDDEKNIYENVTDDQLFNELFEVASARIMCGQNEFINDAQKEFNNKK